MSKDKEALDTPAPTEAAAQLMVLQRTLIVRSKTNPRTQFDPAYLQELADSIRQHGVLQPILVRPLPGARLQDTFEDREPGAPLPTHEIVCGECRWRACGIAEVAALPVLVRDLDDLQVLQVQLVENLKRRDLHPMEEAEGFGRLISEHHMTVEDIAAKVKKSISYVYKSLKLLELTPKCRQELYAGTLSQSTALLVARAPAHLQVEIAKEIMRPQGYDNEPMSFRAAARWIHDHYMLQLGSAIFDIKDASLVAKAGDCVSCPKRTGANSDLFQDVKSADTCTDPKCFDAKKVAHLERIAKAAEAKGQKVIMGKEAQELMPRSWDAPKGYTLLDSTEYIDGVGSRSVRKLLGKDIPTPTLILNPHTQQLQEALPNAVAAKLLKPAKTKAKAEGPGKKAAPRNLKAEYSDAWEGEAITRIHAAIMGGKIKFMGVEVARFLCRALADMALYGSQGDRFCRLFDIKNSKVGTNAAIDEFLRTCPDSLVAPALLVIVLEHELDQDDEKGGPMMQLLATQCEVDLPTLQQDVMLALRAEIGEQPEEEAPAKGKSGKKQGKPAGNAAFMAPLTPSPELAAVIGPDPRTRVDIVSALWAYIKKHGLQDKTNKRMVNADEKLQPVFGKSQVSMFEMAGLIGKHVGDAPAAAGVKPAGKKKTAAKDAQAGIAKALQEQESADGTVDVDTVETPNWPLPVAVTALQPGTRIRVKEGLRGPNNHFRKICGKEGALDKLVQGTWFAKIDGSKDSHRLEAGDFEVLPAATAAAAKPPPLKPQQAWPFPTSSRKGG